MCAIILILIGLAGFFGFTGVQSASLPAQAAPIEATVEAVEPPMQATAVAEQLPELISCESQSQAGDIAEMTRFVAPDSFDPALWTSEGGLQSDRTTTTWTSERLNALAYFEYLHYDCGASQEQIDAYFSDESFTVIFANYDSFEKTAECSSDDLKLLEFEAVLHGHDYHLRYWVWQASPTRVADFTLAFPMYYGAKQADYAERLFPKLPTCEAAE